jgi:putative transposase
MYKYRIYPSKKQIPRLFKTFNTCKDIYNTLLESSINTYKSSGKTLRKFDYNKLISGKHKDLHSQVVQNVSDRVHKAFANFFRRVKNKSCKKKGFPRFKSSIHSITYPQTGFKFLNDKRLRVSKIGSVPIVLHRIPKGKIKTLTIKRNKAGQWFASFACEETMPIVIHPNQEVVGIDVGIESLAVLSTGEVIDNPRFLIKSERRLKLLHRQVSRKKKGSVNRRKARRKLSKLYVKISNQRDDFAHKLSRTFTNKYGVLKVEDLNIQNMLSNYRFAKHISDASWNRLIQFLSYKAVTCGGQVVKVNPRNTSKTCSSCGTIVDMPLAKRKFLCPSCGFSCHRDLNAANNIVKRYGRTDQNLTPVDDCVRPSFGKAVVDESGTIQRLF